MESLVVTTITAQSPEYAEVFALRDELLRRPIGMELKNDDLSRDYIDTFVVGKSDGKVVACLMLQELNKDVVQLRQMAVYTSFQGKGIGRQLVVWAEVYAAGKGFRKIELHARKTAIGFYESIGYSVTSGEFTEVGIPHVMMEKAIS